MWPINAVQCSAPIPRARRRSRVCRGCALLLALVWPGASGGAAPADPPLPAPIAAALAAEKLPHDALVLLVQEAGSTRARLQWQAHRPVNPASLFKLVTTYAALDLLGPAFTWSTPVWLHGPLRDGVLDGDLVIQGQGDPKLVVERLWLMLARVRQLGVREIRGDIVLDRSAFDVPESSPAAFDGEPLRPYNARADALLLSYSSVVYTFTPDVAAKVARVTLLPPLHGLKVDTQVPLAAGPCDDWRAALKATPADPERMAFAGSYAADCGERHWPLAYADPPTFAPRLLRGLWSALGGTLGGQVRDGPAPPTPPSFTLQSPPLAEVVRDINKYSNNVMAHQLFLTLGLQRGGRGSEDAARTVLREWLGRQLGAQAEGIAIDNGSGLSRQARLSAAQLAAVLQLAWRSPQMPELLASLAVAGVDGTARRATAGNGRAHLKTGSLRDVSGIAGVVTAASGRRYVVAAIVNHPQAHRAAPAFQALLRLLADDAPAAGSAQARSTGAAAAPAPRAGRPPPRANQ